MPDSTVPPLTRLLHEHGAAAMARQLAFAERLGERPWELDLDAGRFVVEGDDALGVQLLATHRDESNRWCWSWADESAARFPASGTRAAQLLRDIGDMQGIEALAAPVSVLDDDARRDLVLVCAGLMGACAFFRAPVPGGSVYVLLEGAIIEPTSAVRHVAATFGAVVEQLAFADARLAFVHFCRTFGMHAHGSSDGTITARGTRGELVRARFDGTRFVGAEVELLV